MGFSAPTYFKFFRLPCVILLFACLSACNSTKHIPEGRHLLKSNSVQLHAKNKIAGKPEIKENLNSLVIQKTNTYFLGLFPYKLWLYNLRYKHYISDTASGNFQIKTRTVEPPVLYDSTLQDKTAQNMKSYMFHEGFFYATVSDTVKFKGRKAEARYDIYPGPRYFINDRVLDVDDSTILGLISAQSGASFLKKDQPFTYTLLEQEQSRLTNILRDEGFYKFTNENIRFVLDTLSMADTIAMAGVAADSLAASQLSPRKKKLSIRIIIRREGEPQAYERFAIRRVSILPDYRGRQDIGDTTRTRDTLQGVVFRYHKQYLRQKVILNHTFLEPNTYYRQKNYDKTISRLNDLGVFQYVRIVFVEDTSQPNSLHAVILLSPTQKYDFVTNFEVSNASTYFLGNALSVTLYNRNLFKGANQLSISLAGGLESGYDGSMGKGFFNHFYLLSRNSGINTSIIFPKFIGPFSDRLFSRSATPRTIVGLGYNVLDRLNYFTLTNLKTNFTYNWKETETKTWDVSPAFVNILRLPRVSDSFQVRLDSNDFLRNSYRENFIEGENITFTFNNQAARQLHNSYSFVRLSLEEAGGLLSGINGISKGLGNGFNFSYSKYVQLNADLRHYLKRPRATAAFRFFAGIGIPYGGNTTLPYIKQYYAGGAYSIRGWRIRSLGPGSSPPSEADQNNFIDRTGDIKLEANAEYRFNMFKAFGSTLLVNGAVFTDAGNIWLAHKDPSYPGGEFRFSDLGQSVAVSSGAGVRGDIGGLFVLRVDIAFPLKKPYIREDFGWVLDEIAPGNKTWRQDNIVWQVAIGYPF